MNIYYTINNAELKPLLLGNFNSFHTAESEIRRLMSRQAGSSIDGYLFLHKSALPWQDQEVRYFGQFRLVRIVSSRTARRIGTVNLFSHSLIDEVRHDIGYMNRLPKAS